MSQSEQINELATALSKAQGEMQAAIKDKKGVHNTFYADLGSVWEAARPVLCKYGLCIMQTNEMTPDGSKIILVTTLAHTSGQWVKSYLPLNPSKNDCQGVGAAITYLRRYSLSAFVGVVCDDEDDGETAVGRGKTQSAPPPAKTEAPKAEAVEKVGRTEIIALKTLIENLDEDSNKSFLDWIKKTFSAESIENLPKVAFEKCLVSLNAKIKYLNDQNKAVA